MTAPPARPIFLLGPPGVGKTELGARACAALGWTFAPFAGIDETNASVLEVPWETLLAPRMLESLRRRGTTAALWDRPERMQARASRPYVLRPSTAITTPGSYGRRGTSCVEYRRLERGAEYVLLIDELTLDEAVKELTDVFTEAATDHAAEDRDAFADHLVELWGQDTNAPAKSARALADAMAEFLVARSAAGISERTERALESDLHVGGLLYFTYHRGTPGQVLARFAAGATDTSAFARKITDRPASVARFERAMRAFGEFLRARTEVLARRIP